MLSVIYAGGKQHLAIPGQKIKIEKIKGVKEGEEITFDKVLLVTDREKIDIGKPYLPNVAVIAKVLKIARAPKVIVFRYHPKTRYKKKKGHRQPFIEVEILEIRK